MAAPTMDWREKLKVHPICQRLKKNIGQNVQPDILGNAKGLIAVKNGDLFVWDSYSAQVLHCKLKNLLLDGIESRFQTLVCTDTPRFEVEELLLNTSGSHLAIWGAEGVRVLELPQCWGKHSEFEGGKEVITCRTYSLCTRHLAGSQWVRIRHLAWHPGSPSDTHLAILTSDSIFSVYNLIDTDRPVSIAHIQPGEINTTFSPSKFNISAALGETTVGFDFGPPQELHPIQQPFQIQRKDDTLTVWPVFVVKGNGDILVTYSDVISNRTLQLPTQGPLVMCPPAEDNYGVDACSVLCLDTSPPVIVMATCDGQLHHCIILPSGENEQLSKEIAPSPGVPQFHCPDQPVLYVMESVELELSLSDAIDTSIANLASDPFTCPIKLVRDPCTTDRYHCCHAAGVHSVAVPWVHSLHTFLSSETGNFLLPVDQEAIVEHLICTKPLFSAPSAPILGMDIVSDPNLTPTLLVLSMDFEFTTLPISNKYRSPWSDGLQCAVPLECLSSPLRRIASEPFSQHIARILHRTVSNPLLLTNIKTEMSQEACFQLLMRVTQILREEYVQKQMHAAQELDTRVRILREQKDHQLRELQALEKTKQDVHKKTEVLAERIDSYNEKQNLILKRLENIMRKLQSKIPMLSMAEKKMHTELIDMKAKVEEYSKNLAQLHLKLDYQQRQIGHPKSVQLQQPSLGPDQLTRIKEILREEGNDIAKLIRQTSQLLMETSL